MEARFRFEAMIGVGGIGSGRFFALDSNVTLGREESRGGRFLDRNDYCKLHIISHYVKALLGPRFAGIPIGKVGNDPEGRQLLHEMAEAGLVTRRVEVSPDYPTLFSFCFVYPDGDGGNMTTADSACSRVDADFVTRAECEFAEFAGRGVALAAPEVPLPAREALLKLGTEHNLFRVASFTSEEINWAVDSRLLRDVDLLAINLDEARALLDFNDLTPEGMVTSAVGKLSEAEPSMLISITAGALGSWSWDGRTLHHIPIHAVEVSSTAGAGDAHLSGIIAGLGRGLPLAEAQELGTLVAGMSVTSPHTINKDITRGSLLEFASTLQAPLCAGVRDFLEGLS